MVDARQFNIRNGDGRLLCPACGYPDYSAVLPYHENGALAGSAICPCCLWEPGFDDDPAASAAAKDTILASLHAYRAMWGGVLCWQGQNAQKPSGWDGDQQLTRLFDLAPNVR